MRYIAFREGLARPFQRILRKACQKGGRDRVTWSRSPPPGPAADAAVLAKAMDDVADATVRPGLRVLQPNFGLGRMGRNCPPS